MAEAIITGAFALAAAVITGLISARAASSKTSAEIKTAQAVTDTKIEELTREVREHNNFARRMPVVEERIEGINHRLKALEQNQKGA